MEESTGRAQSPRRNIVFTMHSRRIRVCFRSDAVPHGAGPETKDFIGLSQLRKRKMRSVRHASPHALCCVCIALYSLYSVAGTLLDTHLVKVIDSPETEGLLSSELSSWPTVAWRQACTKTMSTRSQIQLCFRGLYKSEMSIQDKDLSSLPTGKRQSALDRRIFVGRCRRDVDVSRFEGSSSSRYALRSSLSTSPRDDSTGLKSYEVEEVIKRREWCA